jgi:nucleoside-diphosphate-sugar epimerase
MHVLVIGGTRFVGYLTTWRLLAAGHRVTQLNRGTLADPFGARIERLRGDRRIDLARLVGGRSFDAAIDLAAYDAADVAGAVDALGGRVGHYVFVSSGQVYLVREPAPDPDRPTGVDAYAGGVAPRPADPADAAQWAYGIGKRGGEDALASAIAAGFPATSIRMPIVHGERDHQRRLEAYAWRLLDGGPLLVPRAARPTRHVYGGAVARALVDLIGRPPTGRAYNLAQREIVPLGELVALLGRALGSASRVVDVAVERLVEAGLDPGLVSPLSGRWASFLDPARAEAELGFAHEPVTEYVGRIAAAFLAAPPREPPAGSAERARERTLADALG